MKIILTLLATLMLLNLNAQATKTVKVKHKYPHFTEVYEVLKSDNQVRHGFYEKRDFNNRLELRGNFKNNMKDSVWTEYYPNGPKQALRNRGTYENDVRVGVWEYYNWNGELIQKYDHDKDELIEFTLKGLEEEKMYDLLQDEKVVQSKLDRPPMYLGGESDAFKTVEAKIRYPESAIDEEISGKVVISFYIDTNGVAFDHQIETSIGGGCDEEALRIVKLIPNHWLPGVLNGEKVVAKSSFSITFSMY